MKKYVIMAIYLGLFFYLIFFQGVIMVFNPIFSSDHAEDNVGMIAMTIHGIIFIAFLIASGYFGKKLWVSLKK